MTDNSKLYWVWLQSALGVRAKAAKIFTAFTCPQELYEAGAFEWRISGAFTPRQINRLENTSLDIAREIIETCQKNKWGIVTPACEDYPVLLKDIDDYPLALYTHGDLSCLKNKLNLAIVGTRHASAYGTEVAARLAASLTAAGALIVSGGALGIDSAAHRGAMYEKGSTVAVLGCGLASDYLATNQALRNQIAQNGALVTEYPPATPALGSNFPIRNRLISGMSLGTVVIEAGERSGSLITANFALEQGRTVFAVAGDIINSSFTGANKLIRDGAKPVFSALDILEEYEYSHSHIIDLSAVKPLGGEGTVPNPASAKISQNQHEKRPVSKKEKAAKAKTVPPAKRDLPPEIGELETSVYRAVDRQPTHIDDIIRASGREPAQVLVALTQLELLGFIGLTDGKRYVLI